MLKQVLTAVCISAVAASTAAAQAKKAPAAKSVMHDITVTADEVYTGSMEMAIKGGKVTGDMRITSPTEITGKVAGTAEAGVLTLEFPFLMVQENCEGTVKMNIKLTGKPGHGSGTMEAVGCGSDPNDKVTGTVELKPPAAKAVK
jgi:hypothetical protein